MQNDSRELKKLIKDTILATVPYVSAAQKNAHKSFYQLTEGRLWAYPILQDNVNRKYLLDIADLKKEKVPGKSKSIVFWSPTSGGEKPTPEEAQAERIALVELKLAKDTEEIRILDEALSYIAKDQYAQIIDLFYFQNFSATEIADKLPLGTSTVIRQKSRLVKTLALKLYGSFALEE